MIGADRYSCQITDFFKVLRCNIMSASLMHTGAPLLSFLDFKIGGVNDVGNR